MFRIFYRITDNGNPFGQIFDINSPFKHLNKKQCFKNFISVFDINEMIAIADNINDDTYKFLQDVGVNRIVRTSLGNSGSFLTVLNLVLTELKEDDIFYIAEDDYLHMPDGKKFILEGLQKADYVSLYDHLDKYKNPSYNPLVKDGCEETKVFITESIHWKYTNSTTGSFATKVSTIKKDYDIFSKYCHPRYKFPQDFSIFRELITQRGRTLISPIPGKSSHIGLEMSPFIDWFSLIKE
jgi:hypothetical protein